jgi:hypothetical protein
MPPPSKETNATTLVSPPTGDTTHSNVVPMRNSGMPLKILSAIHGFNDGYNGPHQNALINNIRFESMKPLKNIGVNSQNNGTFLGNSDDHKSQLLIKDASVHPNRGAEQRDHLTDGLNAARREVLFHNMSKDFFGMKDSVPLTAGFKYGLKEYSAQQMIPNTSHFSIKSDPNDGSKAIAENPKHAECLKKLYASGDAHKLALMDTIMGHHDRHRGNYLINNDGSGVHLIDNGTAFDYKNFDQHGSRLLSDATSEPTHGHNIEDKQIHPNAKKWLESLDPKDATDLFRKHGYEPHQVHVRKFITRLNFLKNALKEDKYKDTNSLLESARVSSGPLYDHGIKQAS